MHRATNRMFSDVMHRCIARPAAEEWNLATFGHAQDMTNAEFMRTFRSVTFPGGQLVRCLEDAMHRRTAGIVLKLLPSQAMQERMDDEEVLLKYLPDLYGFRGFLPGYEDVYYLNAWEFLMLWEVRRLPAPSSRKGTRHSDAPCLSEWLPGEKEYGLNPEAVAYFADKPHILFYPVIDGNRFLRDNWYMARRMRPQVPAPSGTPMPDRYRSGEQRGKLYSLYLRPWVLHPLWASAGRVPYLCDLNIVPSSTEAPRIHRRLQGKRPAETVTRSYAGAWEWYIAGHVVSRHAARLIVQFMTACCGKSRREEQPEETTARAPRELRSNDMALARLHSILDQVGAGDDADSSGADAEGDAPAEPRRRRGSEQMQNALSTTASLWRRDPTPWSVPPARRCWRRRRPADTEDAEPSEARSRLRSRPASTRSTRKAR